MHKFKIVFLIFLLVFIIGCKDSPRNDTLTKTDDQTLDFEKIATNEQINQQAANDAKEFIKQYDEVADIHAVNNENELIIGIEVDHHERFDLTAIEKELKKGTKRNFNNLTVTLSTDKKALIELQRLEKKLANNNISNQKLAKKITELKKLLKEET